MRIDCKNIIVIIVAIFFIYTGRLDGLCQNNDGFFERRSKPNEPQELITIYNSLGNSLRYAYPDSALFYYKKSLEFSIAEGDKFSRADAIGSIGTVWAIKNNYDSAIYYINYSIKLHKELNNEQGIFKAFNSLGLVELQNDNLESAKKYLLQAAEKSLAINDSALISISYNNLGLLFKRKHNFDSALYFSNAMLKHEQITLNLAYIYSKITLFPCYNSQI